MRARYQPPRRSSGWLIGLGVLGGLLIVGAGTYGGLVAGGVLPMPFSTPAKRSYDGLIAVPRSAMPITANVKLTRDHIWDPVEKMPAVFWLKPEAVTPEMITADKMSAYLGRVLSHDKPAGYVFTEHDFHPPGTRPGFIAQIPPDKQAMVVPSERIAGLQNLRVGDQFDLLGTMPVDIGRLSKNFAVTPPSGLGSLEKQTSVKVLVRRGIVVTGVTQRVDFMESATLAQGKTIKSRPILEMTIAVDPEEIAILTQALALEARIYSVAHSGRPEPSVPPPTSIESASPEEMPAERKGGLQEIDPLANIATVRTIRGSAQNVELFSAEERAEIENSTPRP